MARNIVQFCVTLFVNGSLTTKFKLMHLNNEYARFVAHAFGRYTQKKIETSFEFTELYLLNFLFALHANFFLLYIHSSFHNKKKIRCDVSHFALHFIVIHIVFVQTVCELTRNELFISSLRRSHTMRFN